MCEKAVKDEPYVMKYVPDHFKTQKMCYKAVKNDPSFLQLVSDHFKTQKLCYKAVKNDPSFLQSVPDWFITKEWIDMWYDDDKDKSFELYDDVLDKYNFFEWYEGYHKRKAQKAKIKDELIPIAWHPSRYWDWCISEDEKKETEKLWA